MSKQHALQSVAGEVDPPHRVDLTGAWARDRLRLGQVNVGTWVVMACATLALMPSLPSGSVAEELLLWAILVGGATLVQAPFDFVGGRWIPVRHRRDARPLRAWMGDWFRGLCIHSSAFVVVGWTLMLATRLGGLIAAVGASVALAVALVAVQDVVAQLLAGRSASPLSNALKDRMALRGEALVLTTSDRAFVGGWVGLPGRERLILPGHWLAEHPASVLQVLCRRRQVALDSGARTLGILGALAYNTFVLVAVLATVPGANPATAGGLLLTSAGVTLGAFVGLLTLPRISRLAVGFVDSEAAGELGASQVARAIEAVDPDQEDEIERGPWVETTFHPVPSAANRMRWLAAGPMPIAPYRIARMALFTSWAQLSWLSRAVHCNCGRPELWSLLPGD